MKKPYTLLTLFISVFAWAQSGQYLLYENGLLYPDKAITSLRHVVDSLNKQFGHQDKKQYSSMPQAYYAHYIHVQGKLSAVVKQDIDSGMTYTQIRAKYPDQFYIDSTLAVRDMYENFKEEKVLRIRMMAEGRAYNLHHDFEGEEVTRYINTTKGWLYSYDAPGSHIGENLWACYITAPLTSTPLKDEYARLVQYGEFMVKTNNVFFDDAKKNELFFGDEPGKEMTAFLDYANAQLGQPARQKEEENRAYFNRLAVWETTKWELADRLYATDRKFKRLLAEAYAKTKKGSTDNDFEDYIARYYSAATALEYKRSRIVFGSCGQDEGPHRHDLNIAKLAADTSNWQVFICAHLDIISEVIEKPVNVPVADERLTYVAELEATGINIGDFLIGSCLQIDNPSKMRYEMRIKDAGIVLAEAKNRDIIAKKLLDMIQDKDLDLYNRLRMCYLCQALIDNIQDSAERAQNWALFDKAITSLPRVFYKGFPENENAYFSQD